MSSIGRTPQGIRISRESNTNITMKSEAISRFWEQGLKGLQQKDFIPALEAPELSAMQEAVNEYTIEGEICRDSLESFGVTFPTQTYMEREKERKNGIGMYISFIPFVASIVLFCNLISKAHPEPYLLADGFLGALSLCAIIYFRENYLLQLKRRTDKETRAGQLVSIFNYLACNGEIGEEEAL